MKTIALIDDRKSRQEIYGKDIQEALNHKILDNIQGDRLTDLIGKLKLNDVSCFDPYTVLIIHRSFLDQSVRLMLSDYVNKKRKYLVLFSGGTPTTTLHGQILSLNSKELYSSVFLDFLNESENNNPNIQILAFGIKWKLNVLISLLETVQNYLLTIDNNTVVPIAYLKSVTQFSPELAKYFPESRELTNFGEFPGNEKVNAFDILNKLAHELNYILNKEIEKNERLTD